MTKVIRDTKPVAAGEMTSPHGYWSFDANMFDQPSMALYAASPDSVDIDVEITRIVFEDGEELGLYDSYNAVKAAQQPSGTSP